MPGSAQLSSAPLSPFPIIQALVRQIQRASESQLTGSLNFDTVHVPRMRLYFVVGRLVWASGGLHRLRRWRRLLNQHCPDTLPKLRALATTHEAPQSEYDVLRHLVASHQISRDVARNIIHANIVEVLFDIVQASKLIEKFSYTRIGFLVPNETITLISLEELIHDLENQWNAWCDMNLAPYSPNLSPALIKPETLKAQVTEQTYNRLVQMLGGQLSLRELSILIKWELCRFSQSMITYEQQGIVQLRITPDLALPKGGQSSALAPSQSVSRSQSSDSAHKTPASATPDSSLKPLVMCVDDSPVICKKVEKIVTQAGYRYISVSDPIRALPVMLEESPDLVFIDLVMPVIGGYELCTQIRRMSAFKDTPLIIFSGNMFDRIRGKLAGVNDALSKSVPPEQILAMMLRWLPVEMQD